MGNEEARERLIGAKDFNFFGRQKVCEAIDAAVIALEKRMPTLVDFDGGEWCPDCGCQVYPDNDNFCSNCGKALLWEEEDE